MSFLHKVGGVAAGAGLLTLGAGVVVGKIVAQGTVAAGKGIAAGAKKAAPVVADAGLITLGLGIMATKGTVEGVKSIGKAAKETLTKAETEAKAAIEQIKAKVEEAKAESASAEVKVEVVKDEDVPEIVKETQGASAQVDEALTSLTQQVNQVIDLVEKRAAKKAPRTMELDEFMTSKEPINLDDVIITVNGVVPENLAQNLRDRADLLRKIAQELDKQLKEDKQNG